MSVEHRAYALRATAHRPTDREGQRLAALDLARQRLTHRDIAHVLGLSVDAVAALLSEARIASERTPRTSALPSAAEAERLHAEAWRRSRNEEIQS